MNRKPRARTCEANDCSVKFVPVRPFQTWCSVDCGVKVAQQRQAKKDRRETKAHLLELKPIQHWLKRSERSVHAFIRERDAQQPCISCGTWDTSEWHAGHFIPVGRKAAIRFDYSNIHRQCQQCNIHKGGNATDYEIRLTARIGSSEVDRLKCAPIDHKWTREELQAIEAKAKADLRALRKEREAS